MGQAGEASGARQDEVQEVQGSNQGGRKFAQDARVEDPSTWTPDLSSHQEEDSRPSERGEQRGPRVDEGPSNVAQARSHQTHDTESSAGIIPGVGLQAKATNLGDHTGFQKVLRKGNKSTRTQWIPREQGGASRDSTLGDKDVQILETQAGELAGLHEARVQGNVRGAGSPRGGLPVHIGNGEGSSIPTGRQSDAGRNGLLCREMVQAEGRHPTETQTRSPVVRQIL